MANPLFNLLGNPPSNPYEQIIKQAQDLKRSLAVNPREEVQRLLNSGQMSQEQFNYLSQATQKILGDIGHKL